MYETNSIKRNAGTAVYLCIVTIYPLTSSIWTSKLTYMKPFMNQPKKNFYSRKLGQDFQVTSRLFAQSQRNIQYKHMSDWAGGTEEPLGY